MSPEMRKLCNRAAAVEDRARDLQSTLEADGLPRAVSHWRALIMAMLEEQDRADAEKLRRIAEEL